MEQYDRANYYELNRVLKAQDRKHRAVDPLSSIIGIRAAKQKRTGKSH